MEVFWYTSPITKSKSPWKWVRNPKGNDRVQRILLILREDEVLYHWPCTIQMEGTKHLLLVLTANVGLCEGTFTSKKTPKVRQSVFINWATILRNCMETLFLHHAKSTRNWMNIQLGFQRRCFRHTPKYWGWDLVRPWESAFHIQRSPVEGDQKDQSTSSQGFFRGQKR